MQAIGDARLAIKGAFDVPAPPAVGLREAEGPVPRLHAWQRLVSLAAAVLASLAVGGFSVWSSTRPALPVVVRFPIPLAADQAFTFSGRPTVAISPDGSQVVYVANNSLWLRPLNQLHAVQVPGTAGGRGPFFSADGQSIGFWVSRQLKKVSVSGGAPATLAEGVENPSGASWSADDMILYGQPEGVMQVPGASGTPDPLIRAEEGEVLHGPQMLPGGEWVLFTVRSAGQTSWDEAQIVAQSVMTGERTVLIEGGQDGRYLLTGHLVYILNNVLFDVDSREVTGGAVPLVEEVRVAVGTGAAGGAAHFSVSANGSLVYRPGVAASTGSLVWVDRDGNEEAIPAEPRPYDHPRVSPDGTLVAVDIADGDNTDVWIWDLEGETLTQFTFDEEIDDFPLWTPDSARIVFRSTRDGGGLFWKATDGTGRAERLRDGAARPYAWTVDHRRALRAECGGFGDRGAAASRLAASRAAGPGDAVGRRQHHRRRSLERDAARATTSRAVCAPHATRRVRANGRHRFRRCDLA